MFHQPLNVIEFITHSELLNDHSLSVAQRTVLKATYGLELDPEELEIFQRATGRSEAITSEQSEETIIAGRGSGKTSEIAAPIAIYEALRHRFGPGERGYVMLIAPTKRQAHIAMRYIKGYLTSSRVLRNAVAEWRRDEIELKNNVIIACYPCSYVAVRGVRIICVICDEMGFWHHPETAANPEEEVLAALRPAMATFPTAKLIKISTPFRKEGILWREFQQRAELDHLVWQLPSIEMNPTIQGSKLEDARKYDEARFRREFLAEFTDDLAGWIAPEVLESCVVPSRKELPRVEHVAYVVAVDPAFVRNDFAVAVLHRINTGSIVVDRVEHWTGTKKAPLGYESVCEQVAEIAKAYGIREVLGDQYCAPIIKQFLGQLGIRYHECTFGGHTRADLFGNLRHLMIQRRIELLDEPILLRELRALEERHAPNGNTDIRPSYGQKDDVAVAVALGAFELAKRRPPREPWVEVISIPYGPSALGGSLGGGWFRIS